jgi:hypothetical protein
MDHLVGRLAFHRVDDRDGFAGGEAQAAGVAGLAAAGRVEHGAVEPDAPVIRRDDPRRAGSGISILAKH